MGFGEYLSMMSEQEYVKHERKREEWEFDHSPDVMNCAALSMGSFYFISVIHYLLAGGSKRNDRLV